MGSRSLVALGLAVTLAVHAAPLRADEPTAANRASARSLMDEGWERREHGDLKGALESFRAAEALVKVPTTTLEVARAEIALGLLVEARARLDTLSEPTPGEAPAFAEARRARDHLVEELDGRIPSLHVLVQSGTQLATVTVDGTEVPSAASSPPLKLNPGSHVVVVRASGTSKEETVTLAEGQQRELTMSLESRPVEEHAPPLTPHVFNPSATRTAGYVSLSMGAAGIVVGAVWGAMALSHKSAADKNCVNDHCPASTFPDLDAARSSSTISTVGFTAGGLGLAIGAVLLLISPSHQADERRAHAGVTRPKVAVSPWIGLRGAGLSGQFP